MTYDGQCSHMILPRDDLVSVLPHKWITFASILSRTTSEKVHLMRLELRLTEWTRQDVRMNEGRNVRSRKQKGLKPYLIEIGLSGFLIKSIEFHTYLFLWRWFLWHQFVIFQSSALAMLSQNQTSPQKQDIGGGGSTIKQDEWPRHN